MNFDQIFKRTIAYEGGYVDDPEDRGGETYKGISRKNHADWRGWAMIDQARNYPDFPERLDDIIGLNEAVLEFYSQNYWSKLRCQDMGSMQVAQEVFDTAVNMGKSRAGKFLQQTINAFNRAGRDYSNISEDGIIGPATIAALQECLKVTNEMTVVTALNVLQGDYYLDIMRRDEGQERFARGWFERVKLYA